MGMHGRTLLALVAIASATWAGGSTWEKDPKRALKKAEKASLPLLVEFTDGKASADANKNVFRKPAFKKWAKKKAILVEVNFGRRVSAKLQEQYNALKTKCSVTKYPTFVLLDAKGNLLDTLRLGEKIELEAFVSEADEALGAATSAGKWLTDYELAKRYAKRLDRPMMLSFEGSDW